MRKKIAIISLILIAFAFVLVGCEEQAVGPPTGAPFIGGTQGVMIDFAAETPPAEVYDGGDFPFDVVVKLDNKGEYFVPKEKVAVKLSGISALEFNLPEQALIISPQDDLLATVKDSEGNIIPGNPVYVEFKDLNHIEPITGSVLQFPIKADVCYRYGTVASTAVCVRENILNPEAGGICTINQDKTVFNSAAPIQVTSFKENARSKNKIGFTFTIAHVGTGDVFEQDTLCKREARRFEDKIFVKVTSETGNLECSGLSGPALQEGTVTLYGGTKPITCTLEVAAPRDFETPITIELGYDYEEDIITQIIVKHSG